MANPVLPSSGVLSPLGLDAVRLAPGFWGDRIALNRDVTIAHCQEWEEREGWIGNFRGRLPRKGREFSDSEIYKLLEAMAWADHPALPELAETVARAQEGDGYLNTRWTGNRYTDFEWGHELYCYGHLIQAGVARLRMHGEDRLTEVAKRAADHICRRFMDTSETCGHPVVEMALVELYRATGTARYLEMARRFVERRGLPALGEIPFGRAYFQDDLPVRRAQSLRGHAVRALYLASGVVDVAVETGDEELLKAVEAQWERAVARRTHLTGGMGSRHTDESFGEDYELPPDRAYSETCAGIASIMLAHRLLLATGDARYADVAERTLYNVLATAVALDGRSFFYANPLRVRVPAVPLNGVNHAAEGGLRSPWFDVSCCPNNIARTLASLPAYMATSDAGGVQIHHFTPGEISHGPLALRVETGYPWTGGVRVRVLSGGSGRISLRVPAWAKGATLAYGPAGDTESAAGGSDISHMSGSREVEPGYAVVAGDWQPGDEIHLDLPMAPRWTFPDRRVDALRGSVAVERGPLVYCAESVADEPPLADVAARISSPPIDHEPGPQADHLVDHPADHQVGSPAGASAAVPVPRAAGSEAGAPDPVAGAPAADPTADPATGPAAGPAVDPVVEIEVAVLLGTPATDNWPYRPVPDAPEGVDTVLRLVPYHRWGNRGPATMRVWLPVAD
ncbi:glycoside hydrolase family 127 protein [Nonomuraea aurantiaca]|uniref:glycoside hydrolase family 127 protein n=1 Tax=Nonomuraea aurantiaca TaxID=2878562 RepID=UPI001CD9A090|nr:beta-L-arabinofuranosidase domain-containing protein [Nonomuraea aurantiaca]MCA2219654.1 glycoside hydrolase family 127 protein [Nonomuraea aurantiaca]